jgi:hypothetical protein
MEVYPATRGVMKHAGKTSGPHSAVARELARQTNRSIEDALAAYEKELTMLEAQARVSTYVPVLAKRKARERLLKH